MNQLRNQLTRALNALWYKGNKLYYALVPITYVYLGIIWLRRTAYRFGLLKSVDVGAPVIVVGNLTTGGTGKTPLVVWLARRLRGRGYRVGILCRGYGGSADKWPQPVHAKSDAKLVGDEAKLLAQLAECPVVAGPDRVAAGRMLLRPGNVDVILSDDGLQHYRLKRASEVVVIDGARGLGNRLCLPAGPLREPVTRLREVDAVVVNAGEYDSSRAMHAKMYPVRVRELATGAEKSIADFAGKTVHAVAGIGNPERFFDMLLEHGIDVEPHPLADHAKIEQADISFDDDLLVLVTAKDAVKCVGIDVKNVWCVDAQLEFSPEDAARFESYLTRLLDHQPVNQ